MCRDRGLQRLPWLFMGEFCSDEFAPLLIPQRQQLGGGRRIAGLDVGEDVSNVAHGDQDTAGWGRFNYVRTKCNTIAAAKAVRPVTMRE